MGILRPDSFDSQSTLDWIVLISLYTALAIAIWRVILLAPDILDEVVGMMASQSAFDEVQSELSNG